MDELNGDLQLDNKIADKIINNLAPHKNVFMLNIPHKISENIAFPKPVTATISNWLLNEKNTPFSGDNLLQVLKG